MILLAARGASWLAIGPAQLRYLINASLFVVEVLNGLLKRLDFHGVLPLTNTEYLKEIG
jgi:hypothetical protein